MEYFNQHAKRMYVPRHLIFVFIYMSYREHELNWISTPNRKKNLIGEFYPEHIYILIIILIDA